MGLEQLYRGYTLGTSKGSKEKFKDVPNDQLNTLEQVRAMKGVGYGGILQPNAVMIDVDDEQTKNVMLYVIKAREIHCRVIETTKGCHITMLANPQLSKNMVDVTNCLGLTVTFKWGKNTYECLKKDTDDEERTVLYDSGDYGYMPNFFYPYVTHTKDNVELLGLKEGNRNETLFKWCVSNKILHTDKKTKFNPFLNLSLNDKRFVYNTINTMVFGNPLEQSEVDSMLTEERAKQTDSIIENKTKDKEERLTESLDEFAAKNNIRQIGDELYRRDPKGYDAIITRTWLRHQLQHVVKVGMAKVTTSTDYIKDMITGVPVPFEERYIAFNNGAYDWKDRKFIPQEYVPSDAVLLKYFDANYNPNADTSFVLSTFNEWVEGDEEKLRMLLEFLGTCIYAGDKSFKVWYVITGKADTGKSTFVDVLEEILGDHNISHVAIQKLNNPNAVAEIVDKCVNIVDDGSSTYIKDISPIRQIIQGAKIQIKNLFEDIKTVKLKARMLYVFNSVPRYKDDNGATAKKMRTIKFDNVVPPEKQDKDLKNKLVADREAIFKLAIDTMNEVIDNNFVLFESKESLLARKDMEVECDQVEAFINSFKDDEGNVDLTFFIGQTTSDVFNAYKNWAVAEGYGKMMLTQTYLTRNLNEKLNIETYVANGKRCFRTKR